MSGEAVYPRDFPLETTRHGQAETAYLTFCYSPIRDENGTVLGMIDTVIETTEAVRGHSTACIGMGNATDVRKRARLHGDAEWA